MVPTLSWCISDFALAVTGNLAGPTPQYPTVFGTAASLAAVNFHGFDAAAFPANARTTIAKRRLARARLTPGRVCAPESADEASTLRT
jgi:hypothetical protein